MHSEAQHCDTGERDAIVTVGEPLSDEENKLIPISSSGIGQVTPAVSLAVHPRRFHMAAHGTWRMGLYRCRRRSDHLLRMGRSKALY